MRLRTLVKRVLRRIFRDSEPYQFVSFLYSLYKTQSLGRYDPKDFALYEDGAVIEAGVRITHPDRVFLKKFSVIHRGTLINSVGGFYLGCYSGISYNCTILTGDHRILKSRAIPFDNRVTLKPVFVEDFVMIGANVCIIPGVRIGEGAVVGLGSVVSKDVPPLAIVMGNPAEPIGYRDKRNFNRLKENGRFQSPLVENYEEIVPLSYRRKYQEFFEIIGLVKG